MRLYTEFSLEENLKFKIDEKAIAEKILEKDRPKAAPEWIAFLEKKIKSLDEQIKALESAL